MNRFSLGARVSVGVALVVGLVLVGAGFVVVSLAERHYRREAIAELRRVAGNMTPIIAGSFGIRPTAVSHPSRLPVTLLSPSGQTLASGSSERPPGLHTGKRAPIEPIAVSFAQANHDGGSAVSQLGFLRAVAPSGERLVVGTVPRGFPSMPLDAGSQTVRVAGSSWLSVTIRQASGMLIEVAGHEDVSAQASNLRKTVFETTVLGLVLALIGTLLVSRVALRPLATMRARAARIVDAKDLQVRVREPGQPKEVAALARELDGMLERLNAAVLAREQALLAARRFAADAGHELRTPLQTIRANLDIAGSPGAGSDERKLAIEVATLQSDRMRRLIDGLQGLARGESGLGAGSAEVDVGDIADGAVFVARTRHPELVIDVDLPESGPIVIGDADGLWRVIENLLENAARHGRPGGHVRLRVHELADWVEIIVDDDGPGIPPAERERVMRRFQRGSGATAAGSGLGLAIVEAEATRHGGELSLGVSELGGLRARVNIHAGSRPPSVAASPARAHPHPGLRSSAGDPTSRSG
ncbi:MAG: HAMP domain-containing sensor histidine kinase [Solirubrobacteraceae bacterium]